MVITELYIKNFGKFSDRRIRLHDGVQVISGENEYGKSTIHAFIRAMLFGMERGRGRAAAKDDFTRYEPWENPGYYGGVMRFRCGGRSFRLERSFARPVRPAVLVCEDDGEELSVEQGDLTMLLGGLTEGMFDSTVSVGQLKAEPGKELFEELENYAANYYETGGGEIDLNSAFQILAEKRRNADKKVRREEAAQEERRRKIMQECSYLERDMERLSGEYEERQAELEALSEIPVEEIQEEKGVNEKETKETGNETDDISAKSMLLAGTGGIIAGGMGIAWGTALSSISQTGDGGGLSSLPGLPIAVIGAIIALAGAAVLVAGLVTRSRERRKNSGRRGRSREDRVRKDERTWKDVRTQKDDSIRDGTVREKAERLSWEMERIRAEWKEKEIRCENLREECAEGETGEALREARRRCRVLALAEEELKKAAEETKDQTARLMNRRASEIFSVVTDGKYKGISVGPSMELSAWDGIRRVPGDRLSRGTLEQIYFSVRMAGADLLLEEPMPLILDDVFAFYDEKRLKSVLKWLSGQKKQVIIFTCHKREEEIMKKEDFS